MVYATPNLPVAGVLSSLFFGIWNLFTGFLIGHQVTEIPLQRGSAGQIPPSLLLLTSDG